MLDEKGLFIQAIILGIYLAIIYDGVRIFRRVINHSYFWMSFEDLVYWIYASLYSFVFLYEKNNGHLRWFFFAGILLGAVVYKITISGIIVRNVSKYISKILKIIKRILISIYVPVKKKVKDKNDKVKSSLRRKIKILTQQGWIFRKKLTINIKMINILFRKKKRVKKYGEKKSSVSKKTTE